MCDTEHVRLHYICKWEMYCEIYSHFAAPLARVSPPLPPSPTPGTWGRESVSTCTCSSRWPLASGCNIGRSVWWPWLHLRCQTWRPRAPVWSLKEAEKMTGKQKIIHSGTVFFFFWLRVRLYIFNVWHFYLLCSRFVFPETKAHSLEKTTLNYKVMSRWPWSFFFFCS